MTESRSIQGNGQYGEEGEREGQEPVSSGQGDGEYRGCGDSGEEQGGEWFHGFMVRYPGPMLTVLEL